MTVNLLLSYAYHSQLDITTFKKDMGCGRLMVDSGAFTAHSTGKKINRDAYANFLEDHRGAWNHAITLDVIGDPDGTRVNTRWFHNRGIPVMPVYTVGESLTEFDAMVRDTGYVCVGGGAGGTTAERRFGVLQQRARELGGGIHALGLGSVRFLRTVHPYSADSSRASACTQYGTVMVWNGRECKAIKLNDRPHSNSTRPHCKDTDSTLHTT